MRLPITWGVVPGLRSYWAHGFNRDTGDGAYAGPYRWRWHARLIAWWRTRRQVQP